MHLLPTLFIKILIIGVPEYFGSVWYAYSMFKYNSYWYAFVSLHGRISGQVQRSDIGVSPSLEAILKSCFLSNCFFIWFLYHVVLASGHSFCRVLRRVHPNTFCYYRYLPVSAFIIMSFVCWGEQKEMLLRRYECYISCSPMEQPIVSLWTVLTRLLHYAVNSLYSYLWNNLVDTSIPRSVIFTKQTSS